MKTKMTLTQKIFAVIISGMIVLASGFGIYEKYQAGECGTFFEKCQEDVENFGNHVEILENNINGLNFDD